jgi:hypothetical protein
MATSKTTYAQTCDLSRKKNLCGDLRRFGPVDHPREDTGPPAIRNPEPLGDL